MSLFVRTAIAFAFVTFAVACGGATQEPSPNDGSQGSEVQAEGGESAIIAAPQQCKANPPPNARCAAACPYGYKGPAGTYTCQCCAAPAPGGTVCGGPPPNARCVACPSGYKQIDGRPTCQCCGS